MSSLIQRFIRANNWSKFSQSEESTDLRMLVMRLEQTGQRGDNKLSHMRPFEERRGEFNLHSNLSTLLPIDIV